VSVGGGRTPQPFSSRVIAHHSSRPEPFETRLMKVLNMESRGSSSRMLNYQLSSSTRHFLPSFPRDSTVLNLFYSTFMEYPISIHKPIILGVYTALVTIFKLASYGVLFWLAGKPLEFTRYSRRIIEGLGDSSTVAKIIECFNLRHRHANHSHRSILHGCPRCR